MSACRQPPWPPLTCRVAKILVALLALSGAWGRAGALFPQETETREALPLDGVWRFALGGRQEVDVGFRHRWYQQRLPQWQAMAVPASYNDVTTSAALRDHVGWAWYQREAFARTHWADQKARVFLRFGSVNYFACVWVNDQLAGNHSGGHLPFEFDVTSLLRFGEYNLITVAVNNTLTPLTIPQGMIQRFNGSMYPPNYEINSYTFDFFNYAGIHRSVYFYTVPDTYIDDITVTTEVVGSVGVLGFFISYQISDVREYNSDITCKVSLFNGVLENVKHISVCAGEIYVNTPKLWWPVHMSETPGYLYTVQVELLHSGKRKDVYRLPVGIRTIKWNNNNILINNKPMYLFGFGKHEDSILRGKGLDNTLLVRDYSLIEWIGANSYRTSHYPYAEEALDFADRQGILIIAESPAVNLEYGVHKSVLSEMVKRDKNRPSVIMWSVSNEARTARKKAGPYYQALIRHMKNLDMSRPVGFVTNQKVDLDNAAQYMDFIGVNRYFSWYSDTGQLDLVAHQVENEYTSWYNKFNRPIFVSEYGADAISGFHELPAFVWTEDYQVALLHEYFKAFDILRKKGFFLGEMIWNFADFATRQDVRRAQGNKKGIFTRERQPKHAAYILKDRYHDLGKEHLKMYALDEGSY